MAKNNNLTDFLTDVADAIRAKKGTSGKINPQDFSAEIASIETGGGGGSGTGGTAQTVQPKDVNFYDYDGTILYSYTKNEFLALAELPALPSHSGLICEGWNWTLADAKDYVTQYGIQEIGATYTTDDGKTRLYITVPKYRQDVPLYFQQSVANGVVIDWGDGSATQTLSGTGTVNATHHYEPGDYMITLEPNDSCVLGLGAGTSSYSLLGSPGNDRKVYLSLVTRAELGKRIKILAYAFRYCYNMKSVTIPRNCRTIENYAFAYCSSIDTFIYPDAEGFSAFGEYLHHYSRGLRIISLSKYSSITKNMLHYCSNVRTICIPPNIISLGDYSLGYTLPNRLIIPNGVTTIGQQAICYCDALSKLVLPSGLNTIKTSGICNNIALSHIIFPPNLGTIASGALQYNYGVRYYDFRAATKIPSLGSTTVFNNNNSDMQIIVPDSLYESWKAATNWTNVASKIIKASDYVE